MNHLDVLLPFSLLKIEIASLILRTCKAPALAKLLTCATIRESQKIYNLFSRALPHEYWVASQLGLSLPTPLTVHATDYNNSPPISIAILRATYPQHSLKGHWFILQPVNFFITSNHVILTAIDQVDLTEIEARRLYQSAQLLCAQYNYTLLYVNTKIWLLRADDWAGLRTSSLLAATDRNIEIWMPAGPGDTAWRKLQNEIQIQWFNEILDINTENNERKSVNSLWLWGGANASTPTKNTIYESSFNLTGWLQAATNNRKITNITHLEHILNDSAEHGLLMLDALLKPGLCCQWDIWLEHIATLDKDWFDPMLQALRNKKIDYLSIILSNQQNLIHAIVTASSLKKFWMKSTLSRLAI